MKKMKKKVTRKAPMVPRSYNFGQRVIGIRGADRQPGVLVDAYVTLNNGYRNPAYVVQCDKDGELRSYQHLNAE